MDLEGNALLSLQSDLIMCSVRALLSLNQSTEIHRDAVIQASSKQHHRTPDWSTVVQTPTAALSHERLASVDVASGSQRLRDPIGIIPLYCGRDTEGHSWLPSEMDPSGPAVTGIHEDGYDEP